MVLPPSPLWPPLPTACFSLTRFFVCGCRAQDADANARLDTVLEAYLRLLGAYFLLPAATRTLEYLVRRFRRGPATVRAQAGRR